MKTLPSCIKPCLPIAAKIFAALLFLMSLTHQAEAQSYSLSPVWSLATSASLRSLGYSSVSNQVFLPNTGGSIAVYDGSTGTSVGNVSFSGLTTSGTQVINQLGVADDGAIYGANLSAAVSGSSVYRIYRWSSWNATGSNAYTGDPTLGSTVDGKRLGDSFAVTGSGVNTRILTGVAATNCFVIFSTLDGTNFTPTIITNITGLPNFSTGGLGLTFFTNNTFLVRLSASTSVYLVQYPANFASSSGVSGTVLATTPLPTPASPASSAIPILSYNANASLLAVTFVGSSTVSGQNYYSQLYRLNSTNFNAGTTLLTSTNYVAASNGNLTGGTALGGAGNTNFFYSFNSANTLQAFAVNFTSAPLAPTIATAPAGISGVFAYNVFVIANGTAPLKYQWLASNAGTNISSTFTNVPSATNSSYAINVASTNYYEVIITNSAGSVTSAPVRVAILTSVTSTTVTQLWRVAAGTAGYSYLSTDGTTRGLGYDTNSQRLVVANNGGIIYILDANNGTNIGTMNMTGADTGGGDFLLDQVVAADDGAVYSGNLATSNGKHFKLNRWSGPFATETAIVAYDDSVSTVLKTGDRWGDTMAVRGAGPNTQILLPSRNGTNVALLTTADGTNFSAVIIPVTGVPPGFSGLGITFGDGNSFWSKTTGGDLRKISFDPMPLTTTVVLDYLSSAQIPSSMVGLGVDPIKNILAGIILNDTPNDMQLFQLTGTPDAPVLFHQGFFASANANGNGSAAIAMKFPRVYGLDANNGILALTYDTPPTTAPTINTPPVSQTAYTNIPSISFGVGASGSLPLYYQWQFSHTTNNAGFTNIITGTNSSYTIANPALSAAGYYRVIVRNVAGFATSAPPALLTLLVPTTSVVVTQLWTLPAGSLSFLDGSSYNTRGLAYDTNSGTLAVADHGNIHLLVATNGSYLGDLNTIGIFNGGLNGWLFNQVGVADDGALYAGNLTLTGTGFSIVTWTPGYGVGTPASGYAYGGGTGGDPGSGSGERWGDTMDVRGAGVNTEILIGSYGGTNAVLFTTTDGSSFTANLIAVTNVPAGFGGQGIAFGNGDSFYTKSPGYLLRKVTFDRTTWTGSATLVYSSMPSAFDGIGVDVSANILGGVNFSDTPNDLQLYLLSGNVNSPSLFDQAFFGSNNLNSQQNAVTTLKAGLGFALDVNNGITAVSYSIPSAPAVTLTSIAYAPGSVTLNWNNTFNNHGYQVQYKNNLLDVSWTNVGSPVIATGATASYTDTTSAGATRFYRVISQ